MDDDYPFCLFWEELSSHIPVVERHEIKKALGERQINENEQLLNQLKGLLEIAKKYEDFVDKKAESVSSSKPKTSKDREMLEREISLGLNRLLGLHFQLAANSSETIRPSSAESVLCLPRRLMSFETNTDDQSTLLKIVSKSPFQSEDRSIFRYLCSASIPLPDRPSTSSSSSRTSLSATQSSRTSLSGTQSRFT